MTPDFGIACASARPVINASFDDATRRSGDHRADGKPVDAAGSKTAIWPLPARAATVTSYKSRFTETITAGPSQVAAAAVASCVLPEPVGPISATDPREP